MASNRTPLNTGGPGGAGGSSSSSSAARGLGLKPLPPPKNKKLTIAQIERQTQGLTLLPEEIDPDPFLLPDNDELRDDFFPDRASLPPLPAVPAPDEDFEAINFAASLKFRGTARIVDNETSSEEEWSEDDSEVDSRLLMSPRVFEKVVEGDRNDLSPSARNNKSPSALAGSAKRKSTVLAQDRTPRPVAGAVAKARPPLKPVVLAGQTALLDAPREVFGGASAGTPRSKDAVLGKTVAVQDDVQLLRENQEKSPPPAVLVEGSLLPESAKVDVSPAAVAEEDMLDFGEDDDGDNAPLAWMDPNEQEENQNVANTPSRNNDTAAQVEHTSASVQTNTAGADPARSSADATSSVHTGSNKRPADLTTVSEAGAAALGKKQSSIGAPAGAATGVVSDELAPGAGPATKVQKVASSSPASGGPAVLANALSGPAGGGGGPAAAVLSSTSNHASENEASSASSGEHHAQKVKTRKLIAAPYWASLLGKTSVDTFQSSMPEWISQHTGLTLVMPRQRRVPNNTTSIQHLHDQGARNAGQNTVILDIGASTATTATVVPPPPAASPKPTTSSSKPSRPGAVVLVPSTKYLQSQQQANENNEVTNEASGKITSAKIGNSKIMQQLLSTADQVAKTAYNQAKTALEQSGGNLSLAVTASPVLKAVTHQPQPVGKPGSTQHHLLLEQLKKPPPPPEVLDHVQCLAKEWKDAFHYALQTFPTEILKQHYGVSIVGGDHEIEKQIKRQTKPKQLYPPPLLGAAQVAANLHWGRVNRQLLLSANKWQKCSDDYILEKQLLDGTIAQEEWKHKGEKGGIRGLLDTVKAKRNNDPKIWERELMMSEGGWKPPSNILEVMDQRGIGFDNSVQAQATRFESQNLGWDDSYHYSGFSDQNYYVIDSNTGQIVHANSYSVPTGSTSGGKDWWGTTGAPAHANKSNESASNFYGYGPAPPPNTMPFRRPDSRGANNVPSKPWWEMDAVPDDTSAQNNFVQQQNYTPHDSYAYGSGWQQQHPMVDDYLETHRAEQQHAAGTASVVLQQPSDPYGYGPLEQDKPKPDPALPVGGARSSSGIDSVWNFGHQSSGIDTALPAGVLRQMAWGAGAPSVNVDGKASVFVPPQHQDPAGKASVFVQQQGGVASTFVPQFQSDDKGSVWPQSDGKGSVWPAQNDGKGSVWPRNDGKGSVWPQKNDGKGSVWPQKNDGKGSVWPQNDGKSSVWPAKNDGKSSVWPAKNDGSSSVWPPQKSDGKASTWHHNQYQQKDGKGSMWPAAAQTMHQNDSSAYQAGHQSSVSILNTIGEVLDENGNPISNEDQLQQELDRVRNEQLKQDQPVLGFAAETLMKPDVVVPEAPAGTTGGANTSAAPEGAAGPVSGVATAGNLGAPASVHHHQHHPGAMSHLPLSGGGVMSQQLGLLSANKGGSSSSQPSQPLFMHGAASAPPYMMHQHQGGKASTRPAPTPWPEEDENRPLTKDEKWWQEAKKGGKRKMGIAIKSQKKDPEVFWHEGLQKYATKEEALKYKEELEEERELALIREKNEAEMAVLRGALEEAGDVVHRVPQELIDAYAKMEPIDQPKVRKRPAEVVQEEENINLRQQDVERDQFLSPPGAGASSQFNFPPPAPIGGTESSMGGPLLPEPLPMGNNVQGGLIPPGMSDAKDTLVLELPSAGSIGVDIIPLKGKNAPGRWVNFTDSFAKDKAKGLKGGTSNKGNNKDEAPEQAETKFKQYTVDGRELKDVYSYTGGERVIAGDKENQKLEPLKEESAPPREVEKEPADVQDQNSTRRSVSPETSKNRLKLDDRRSSVGSSNRGEPERPGGQNATNNDGNNKNDASSPSENQNKTVTQKASLEFLLENDLLSEAEKAELLAKKGKSAADLPSLKPKAATAGSQPAASSTVQPEQDVFYKSGKSYYTDPHHVVAPSSFTSAPGPYGKMKPPFSSKGGKFGPPKGGAFGDKKGPKHHQPSLAQQPMSHDGKSFMDVLAKIGGKDGKKFSSFVSSKDREYLEKEEERKKNEEANLPKGSPAEGGAAGNAAVLVEEGLNNKAPGDPQSDQTQAQKVKETEKSNLHEEDTKDVEFDPIAGSFVNKKTGAVVTRKKLVKNEEELKPPSPVAHVVPPTSSLRAGGPGGGTTAGGGASFGTPAAALPPLVGAQPSSSSTSSSYGATASVYNHHQPHLHHAGKATPSAHLVPASTFATGIGSTYSSSAAPGGVQSALQVGVSSYAPQAGGPTNAQQSYNPAPGHHSTVVVQPHHHQPALQQPVLTPGAGPGHQSTIIHQPAPHHYGAAQAQPPGQQGYHSTLPPSHHSSAGHQSVAPSVHPPPQPGHHSVVVPPSGIASSTYSHFNQGPPGAPPHAPPPEPPQFQHTQTQHTQQFEYYKTQEYWRGSDYRETWTTTTTKVPQGWDEHVRTDNSPDKNNGFVQLQPAIGYNNVGEYGEKSAPAPGAGGYGSFSSAPSGTGSFYSGGGQQQQPYSSSASAGAAGPGSYYQPGDHAGGPGGVSSYYDPQQQHPQVAYGAGTSSTYSTAPDQYSSAGQQHQYGGSSASSSAPPYGVVHHQQSPNPTAAHQPHYHQSNNPYGGGGAPGAPAASSTSSTGGYEQQQHHHQDPYSHHEQTGYVDSSQYLHGDPSFAGLGVDADYRKPSSSNRSRYLPYNRQGAPGAGGQPSSTAPTSSYVVHNAGGGIASAPPGVVSVAGSGIASAAPVGASGVASTIVYHQYQQPAAHPGAGGPTFASSPANPAQHQQHNPYGGGAAKGKDSQQAQQHYATTGIYGGVGSAPPPVHYDYFQ
ncbi:unnamed protein product [Amoebophrya sp. A120]|nr:unnamed protein product [Amoebophrya sp. A120]|eukprot:GSA120T00009293001.1